MAPHTGLRSTGSPFAPPVGVGRSITGCNASPSSNSGSPRGTGRVRRRGWHACPCGPLEWRPDCHDDTLATYEHRRARRPATGHFDRRSDVSFHASLDDLPFRVGGYVVQVAGDDRWLGQVLTLELDYIDRDSGASAPGSGSYTVRRMAAAVGTGSVLGEGRPFHDVRLAPATATHVLEWQAASRSAGPASEVGQIANLDGVPARLDPGGFDRHTFLCGRVGSGRRTRSASSWNTC